MKHRQVLLGILLLALLAAGALVLFDRRGAAEPRLHETGWAAEVLAGAAPLEAGALADGEPGALTREKVRPAGAEEGGAAEAGHVPAPVHLRVALRILNDAGEAEPPPGCRGWLVQAQSWEAATRSITVHEAFADARGIAEFVFDDAVHVDWVSCQPRTPRWGYTYLEQHADMDGGSRDEWTLFLQAAGSASGLVLNAQDRPVANAVVHVFNPDWSYGLDNWTPGFLHTTTGADGRFHFPALSAGRWIFAVEPVSWLQFSPTLGGGTDGADLVEVPAGATTEVGPLRVVAADGIEVEVVDAAGQPVAQAHVWAQPLAFADAALGVPAAAGQPSASGDPVFERFLSGENWETLFDEVEDPAPGLDAGYWANESLSRSTDAQGRARFSLPAGRWQFGCWLEMMSDGQMELTTHEALVPGPILRITLPFRLRSFAGQLVNERGEPIGHADLQLRSPDGATSLDANAGSDGRFVFPAAPASGRWELQAWSDGAVSCWWAVDLAGNEPSQYFLPSRAPIRFEFRTSEGDPFSQENGYLTIRPLQWEMPPAPPGARAGEPGWMHEEGVMTLPLDADGNGLNLLPGSYEAVLGAYAWQGQWSEWGPAYELVEIARWIVSPRPEPWLLVATPLPIHPEEGVMAKITGCVRDAATLEPLAEAEIQAHRGAAVLGVAQSAPDGSYALLLPPGEYSLSAHRPGHVFGELSASRYDAGAHARDLALAPGGIQLTALVRDRDGRRVPPCEIRIYSGATASSPVAQFWSQDGRVILADLPEGSLVLEAQFWGAVTARGVVKVHAGEARETEVRLDLTLEELREQLRAQPPPEQQVRFDSILGQVFETGVWRR